MGTDRTKILKALSDDNRLEAVARIAKAEKICAKDLLEGMDITQPTLSHHMKLLTDSGLIDNVKEGRLRYYSINREVADEFLGSLKAILSGEEQ